MFFFIAIFVSITIVYTGQIIKKTLCFKFITGDFLIKRSAAHRDGGSRIRNLLLGGINCHIFCDTEMEII